MSTSSYPSPNLIADLSPNAVKLNSNNEWSEQEDFTALKEDLEFKNIFDAILSTFQSKQLDNMKHDCPDSDEFSSDSDDEETNLISQKLVPSSKNIPKEQVFKTLSHWWYRNKIVILGLGQKHLNHIHLWQRHPLFSNH